MNGQFPESVPVGSSQPHLVVHLDPLLETYKNQTDGSCQDLTMEVLDTPPLLNSIAKRHTECELSAGGHV